MYTADGSGISPFGAQAVPGWEGRGKWRKGGAWFESGVCGAGGEFLVRGSKRGWDGRGGMGVRGRERGFGRGFWSTEEGFSRVECYVTRDHQGSSGDPCP